MDFSHSTRQQSDWAWLPDNILFMITELFLLSDLFRFGSVCTSWRAFFKSKIEELNIQTNMVLRSRLPMLLIPTSNMPGRPRNLYSVSEGQVYDLRLPVPQNTRCIGSCHGWLIFMKPVSFMVTLFNPFYFGNMKGTINLPPFLPARDFYESVQDEVCLEYFICKVVLSSDPVTSPKYTVMLTYGRDRQVAYYKSGDENWSFIEGSYIYDMIYSDGHFIAVSVTGKVFLSDPEADYPQLEAITEILELPTRLGSMRIGQLYVPQRYIAKSSDGNSLFQVVKLFEYRPNGDGSISSHTIGFWVFRLRIPKVYFEWDEVRSLGGDAVFVGDSYSYCVRASDFPGIIPNAIYFTDDYRSYRAANCTNPHFWGPPDASVYILGERRFRRHYDPGDGGREWYIPPHIWITPTV